MSVALVTRNRPDSLERTLESLRGQDSQPWEVVISDDSDPDIAPDVRRLAARFDCGYIEGPRRGLYANRNRSALACRGTHVRTMDDDHEFPPRHVATCLGAIAGDPEAIWVIGERLPDAPEEQGRVCPPQLHPRGFSATPTGDGPMWSIADGSSIYPRTVFGRGLRFAEEFPFGAAYLEWGSRLHWLGYRIRHLSETHVIHHFDERSRSYLDDRIDLSSRFFAMFAHAGLYQPTLANRLLCGAEVLKQTLRAPSLAFASARVARRVYREHRDVALRDRLAHAP